jgi:hypothetical protein
LPFTSQPPVPDLGPPALRATLHARCFPLQESRDVNAKLHAEASSLRGQLDTANKLLAAPDKPALDSALHMALQVCAA